MYQKNMLRKLLYVMHVDIIAHLHSVRRHSAEGAVLYCLTQKNLLIIGKIGKILYIHYDGIPRKHIRIHGTTFLRNLGEIEDDRSNNKQ